MVVRVFGGQCDSDDGGPDPHSGSRPEGAIRSGAAFLSLKDEPIKETARQTLRPGRAELRPRGRSRDGRPAPSRTAARRWHQDWGPGAEPISVTEPVDRGQRPGGRGSRSLWTVTQGGGAVRREPQRLPHPNRPLCGARGWNEQHSEGPRHPAGASLVPWSCHSPRRLRG